MSTIRHWTAEETEYLLDNCGIQSNRRIACKLGRSHHAIRTQLSNRKVSVFSNFYTARLLGKELGRDHSTVMQWYRKGWLKGKVADWGRGFMHSPMVFTESGIVDFLKEKYYLFDGRKIPNPYFRNVVKEAGLPER